MAQKDKARKVATAGQDKAASRADSQKTIVSARIHPAIGIARVGDAPDAFFLAPETTEPKTEAAGFYRDDKGRLKRQAQRFRIFGYDAAGEPVAEITAAEADIAWTVEVANLKSSWFQFQMALDVPEADAAMPSLRRNADIADRASLEIRPKPRTIAGRSQSEREIFDDGAFQGEKVYLGELRTDEAGRLIFLGGRGVARNPKNVALSTFANNDGWYDDTSDGSVTATVTLDGRAIAVDPAWIVVAPPNYAPGLKSVRTLYDLLTEVFVETGALTLPQQISFQRDVYPIFRRLSDLQWVNAGFAEAFGPGGRFEFTRAETLARLASNDPAEAELRRQVANLFRDYDRDSWSPTPLPWIYGDSMDIPPVHTPRQHSRLARSQMDALERWAEGNFVADFDAEGDAAFELESLPLHERPAMLDRAALDFCLADAFHPGCEVTWPIRHPSMFMAPFRLRHRRADEADPRLSSPLSPLQALAYGGLMFGQRPGWITRWMAVPWQADTASCRSGYMTSYDPYLPTFWPAHVPNQVLTEEDYEVAVAPDKPAAARLAAFRRRSDWDENGLGPPPYIDQVQRMPSDFGQMGLVEVRPGPTDLPGIPSRLRVADRPKAAGVRKAAAARPAHAQRPSHEGDMLQRFGRYPRGLPPQVR